MADTSIQRPENLEELGVVVKTSLMKQLEIHKLRTRDIVLSKRTKDFKKGDFSVPVACLKRVPSKEEFDDVKKTLLELSQRWLIKIRDVTSDGFSAFIIHINRQDLYRQVLLSVAQSAQYGQQCTPEPRTILVNVSQAFIPVQKGNGDSSISVDQLRAVILAQHISFLLQAQGHSVIVSRCKLPSAVKDLLTQICMDEEFIRQQDRNEALGVRERLQAHCSHCRSSSSSTKRARETPLTGAGDPLSDRPDSLVFNFKQYLETEGLPTGKGNFDKNLNIFQVPGDEEEGKNPVLTQVSALQAEVQAREDISLCLHLVPHSLSFSQQKVHLLWRAVTDKTHLSQLHLVHGPVSLSRSSQHVDSLSASDYIRIRHEEMREAAVMKYGNTVKGAGWERTITAVTAACVKFELLSTVYHNTVKLTLSEDSGDGRAGDASSGSFVMYNCARLATLFSHFQEAVEKGIYPPLPPVDDVDFTTLREEAEWELMFSYVAPFPSLVRQTAEDLSATGTIQARIHTHKALLVAFETTACITPQVCTMLQGLSRCLSSYYSRYHVLGENRPHLLPTLYARLHLLKAVHTVIVNSLALLGLQALTQL